MQGSATIVYGAKQSIMAAWISITRLCGLIMPYTDTLTFAIISHYVAMAKKTQLHFPLGVHPLIRSHDYFWPNFRLKLHVKHYIFGAELNYEPLKHFQKALCAIIRAKKRNR